VFDWQWMVVEIFGQLLLIILVRAQGLYNSWLFSRLSLVMNGGGTEGAVYCECLGCVILMSVGV
jgi:hypothetical protein